MGKPSITIQVQVGRGVDAATVEFDRGDRDAGLRSLAQVLPAIESLDRLAREAPRPTAHGEPSRAA